MTLALKKLLIEVLGVLFAILDLADFFIAVGFQSSFVLVIAC